MYNTWLLRVGFDNLIKEEWELLDSNLKCHEKFRRLKDKIKQWSNNIKTLERNRKTVALEEINSIEKRIDEGFIMPSDNDHRLILLQEIEKIDKFASMDIIQKAHVKWDIEGDENSKFFHGLINQKRRNQMINGIMVTLEEIKEAVWDCGSSKAPGPDGYSFAFVKNFGVGNKWCSLVLKLFSFFRELLFHNNGSPTLSFPLSVVLGKGDPLSPFLSSWLWKVFFIYAFEEAWNGLITGVNIKNSTINVISLSFTCFPLGKLKSSLTIGGRLTLIKSVLGHQSYHGQEGVSIQMIVSVQGIGQLVGTSNCSSTRKAKAGYGFISKADPEAMEEYVWGVGWMFVS
ncbi:hypothetical protein Tco_0444736 [Tanacetum coccineum]